MISNRSYYVNMKDIKINIDELKYICIGDCQRRQSNSQFLKNNGAEAHCF